MSYPLNVPTDDALIMLSASSGTSDTEDPVGKGRREMFVPQKRNPLPRSKRGNSAPQAGGFQLTPGAKNIP